MKTFGTSTRWALAVAVAAVLTANCARTRPVIAPEIPSQPSDSAPSAPVVPPTSTVESEARLRPAEYPERGIGAGDLPTDLVELNRAGYLADAFFETDRHDLTEAAREALAANAAWLRAHPTVRILVEGHCDERNTSEYNMALGWRRANAVKSYLVSLGVDGSRIETVSYGKERPFMLGSNEYAWSQNRRGHFKIVGR